MYMLIGRTQSTFNGQNNDQRKIHMNLQILFFKLKKDPKWIDNNTTHMLLDHLVIVDDGGQVRQGGIDASHVADLEADILLNGQIVPITVSDKLFSPGHEHEGKFAVYEGNHRLEALRNLNRKLSPEGDDRFAMVRVYQTNFASSLEKRSYQLECNEHVTAKSSSDEDYALVLQNELKSGNRVSGLTWKNFDEKGSNLDLLKKWCKSHWKINGNRINVIIKKALYGNPNAKLKNYTKYSLLDFFKNHNNIGWAGKKAGEECNNYAVYTMSSANHVFPNLTGNAFKVKTDNSKTKTVAVCWETSTLGKSSKKMKEFRQRAVSSVNKANASALLDKTATLVDKLVFAPQLKREKGLIWVQKDSNGKFIF